MFARPTPDCPRELRHAARLFGVLLGTLLVAACSEPAREQVRLADFDFAEVHADSLYGPVAGADRGLHEFDEHWMVPKGEAMWSLGPRSAVDLTLVGRAARLTLHATTSPDLVNEGQVLTLFFNGREVARHTFSGSWEVDTLEVDLPDETLKSGANRLEFVTDRQQRSVKPNTPPRAVYLHALRVDASLSADELDTWRRWSEPAPPDPAHARVHLPLDPATAHLPQRQEFGPEQPDLLVVVLDAARADHISCYGYARETTPHVDRLAAEGVKLTNLWAEAPYTRSSIATFFTGHSWRDHGVILHRHSLSPGFTTLAEVLQEAGYYTLGISDNANVARSAGSDQGFEEWVQTWTDVRVKRPAGASWWDPELPERLWRDRMRRELPTGRPVFAYVHLMPPHEPYFPGDEHDVFGPENYAGEVIGNTPNIRDFEAGRFAAEGPDHDRLVALYDGHLRRGDAILARVLEAWRARSEERGRPTLTLFLSDHGEAFGEHGRYGHNSSPHEEMTRVPVVLHPRALVPESLQESPDAFRAMSDLLPLLLHTLKVPLPPGTTWPRRVLHVLEDPSVAREEIFLRCTAPIYGRRTPDSMTVLRVWGEQSWYSLAQDPRALRDLRWTSDHDYLESLRRLRGFVEGGGEASPVAADLSEEDLARLKALGYL